jgi:hypothetical protein
MIWPLASAFSRRSWNETTATKMVVLTTDEVLQKGLSMVGFDHDRQKNVSRETNLQRFRAHYGSNPIVYAQIWEDLSLLTETDAWKMDPDSFLMACHFLTCYPTEHFNPSVSCCSFAVLLAVGREQWKCDFELLLT